MRCEEIRKGVAVDMRLRKITRTGDMGQDVFPSRRICGSSVNLLMFAAEFSVEPRKP